MTDKLIYLDNAAATPLSEVAHVAMDPFWAQQFYNPSATYIAGQHVQAALQQARISVAHWLGARPSEIIFTAGGTEANNLVIHGVMRQYPEANVVVSAVEHDAVLAPAGRYPHSLVAVGADGIVDLSALEQAIDDQTVLVSIMYANNEVGSLQPIKRIGQLVAEVRRQRLATNNQLPLYLHTDACQAANYLDLHVARLGVDLLTLNGGKIYGPKQSGVLFVRGGLTLTPLIDGGGQEQGLRSGTENVAQAVGLAAALEAVQTVCHDEAQRLHNLQQQFMIGLTQQLPSSVINGSRKQRLPNNVHVTFPGMDNERLLMQLDERGILAAAGSACSASNEAASHVLLAMGITEQDARSSVRFTLGQTTTAADIEATLKALTELVAATNRA